MVAGDWWIGWLVGVLLGAVPMWRFAALRARRAAEAAARQAGPQAEALATALRENASLQADLDREGTECALVIPNYGVPDPTASFALNELVVEAAQTDERIRAGLWTSPRPQDAVATEKALALAGEQGVSALKLSFLLGGRATDEACLPQLDSIFATAREHDLVVCLEDNGRVGGVGSMVVQALSDADVTTPVRVHAVPQEFLTHAKRDKILERVGLTPPTVLADTLAHL